MLNDIFKHRLGQITDRSYEDQWYKASGLNLVVAAIIVWNTVYLAKVVEVLAQTGKAMPQGHLRHLSPLG